MKNKQNQSTRKISPAFFIILTSVIFLLTCSLVYLFSGSNQYQTAPRHQSSAVRTKRENKNLQNKDPFPFAIIRTKSRLRTRRADLDAIPDNLIPMSEKFFRQWLKNTTITDSNHKLIYPAGGQPKHYFYDYAETDDLFLFSIIRRNPDVSQTVLIHYTCSKKNGKINHAEVVAISGDQSGFSIHSRIEYSADRLTLTSTSGITQLIGRHLETSTRITRYLFRPEEVLIKHLK